MPDTGATALLPVTQDNRLRALVRYLCSQPCYED
jgi:hypothetical protein